MSKKTIINIKSLTINLNGETVRSGGLFGIPSGLLAALVGGFGSVETKGKEEVTAATGDAPQAESADAPVATADVTVTADEVMAFLRSDPRYTQRTESSVMEHFGDNADVASMVLKNLVAAGAVTTKRRRADGVTLYTAAPVQAPTPAEAAPEIGTVASLDLNETNVRSFIGSDARYTKRTAESIAKHFGLDADSYDVERMLGGMVDNGDMDTTTRRSDGVTLYELA